jgi:RNA polymerase sigma-70 factor, ECF subfamily
MSEVDRLALRAARGDRAAFEAVCTELADDVWRYCRALAGEEELARDAAQDTFVRAATAIARYRGDAPVRVWLLSIARRAVADAIRREQRHRRSRPVAEVPTGSAPDHAGHVDVQHLIAALDEPLRQAFVLTQVIGLSYEEAAEAAGVRIGTIRSRVHRARERLVAAMGQEAPGRRSA